MAKKSGKETAATHTRFEELVKKQKSSNDPGKGLRAVSSSDDPDSDPEHVESHDGSSFKSMRRQSSSDRSENDDGQNQGGSMNRPLVPEWSQRQMPQMTTQK